MSARARELAPYFVVLGAGIYFFDLAEHFQFPSIAGRIGPDAWPKLVLVLLCAVCVFEILRRLIIAVRARPSGIQGAAPHGPNPHGPNPHGSNLHGAISHKVIPHGTAQDDVEQDGDLAIEDGPVHPGLVAGAVAATVVYLLILETTGFFLTTFVYMAILMWLGGFRRPTILLPLSAAAALVFMFLFMRIIFVALPLGIEPFARISIALMTAMGIH